MNELPKLSDEEMTVVIQLLEREYHDLPTEIHHTRVASYREELRRREEIVKHLLDRLQAASV